MLSKVRFGLIVPSPNVVIEPEYYHISSSDIGIHTSRVMLNDCTTEKLRKMSEHVERAARELSTAKVNAILYACTSGSLINGLEWENNLVAKICEASGVPALTTSGCVANVLESYGIRKIIVFTPYIDEINQREKIFLESLGFEVLKITGLGIIDAVTIGDVDPEITRKSVIKMCEDYKEAEGVFISCTNLRTFEIIDKLEAETNMTVVTSNQASYWGLLKLCGLRPNLHGYGKIFGSLK